MSETPISLPVSTPEQAQYMYDAINNANQRALLTGEDIPPWRLAWVRQLLVSKLAKAAPAVWGMSAQPVIYPAFTAEYRPDGSLTFDVVASPTVCISGSMRGEWAMRRHAADLYAAGHPVLYPWPLPADGAHTVDPAVTHRRQIDLADVMHVVTVDGYLGDHTRGEIAYAEQAGIPVEYVDFAGGAR